MYTMHESSLYTEVHADCVILYCLLKSFYISLYLAHYTSDSIFVSAVQPVISSCYLLFSVSYLTEECREVTFMNVHFMNA